MSDLKAVAKQALDALCLWATGRDMDAVALNDLIDRLEAALAETHEPVAVTVEAVAEVFEKDGEPELCWLIEGGIYALSEGDVLVIAHRPITGDDGSGEVYTTPPQRPVQPVQDHFPDATKMVQEPVAWIEHEWAGTGLRKLHFEKRDPTVRDEVVNPVWTPLYADPPQRPAEPVQEPDDKADSIRWQLCLLAQTEEFSDEVRNQIARGVWLIDKLRTAPSPAAPIIKPEIKDDKPVPPPEAQTEAEKIAYYAGWSDALAAERKELLEVTQAQMAHAEAIANHENKN